MLIYRNNALGFISDVRENTIADTMAAAAEFLGDSRELPG